MLPIWIWILFKCFLFWVKTRISNLAIFSSTALMWSSFSSSNQGPLVLSPWQYAPNHLLFNFKLWTRHWISALLWRENPICFCKRGKFLIRLFVMSAGNDTGEELVGLLGQLKIMFLLTERPPLQTLICSPIFIYIFIYRHIISTFWTSTSEKDTSILTKFFITPRNSMIFVGQSTDFSTLITKPRCCNRKINVSLPISMCSSLSLFLFLMLSLAKYRLDWQAASLSVF